MSAKSKAIITEQSRIRKVCAFVAIASDGCDDNLFFELAAQYGFAFFMATAGIKYGEAGAFDVFFVFCPCTKVAFARASTDSGKFFARLRQRTFFEFGKSNQAAFAFDEMNIQVAPKPDICF